MSDDGFGPRPVGAYRGEIPRCPACGDALEATLAGSAEIDVCPRCGGIWFDWTDGDVVSLARRATRSTPTVGARAEEITGGGRCPRCRDPLGEDAIRGITVARCAGCAGAFVTRDAAEAIVAAQPEPEGSASSEFFARLVTWFNDVLHPTRALLRDAGLAPESEKS